MDSPANRLQQALRAARSVVLQAEQRRLHGERQALYDRLYRFQEENSVDDAMRGKVRLRAPVVAEPATRAVAEALEAAERRRRRA